MRYRPPSAECWAFRSQTRAEMCVWVRPSLPGRDEQPALGVKGGREQSSPSFRIHDQTTIGGCERARTVSGTSGADALRSCNVIAHFVARATVVLT